MSPYGDFVLVSAFGDMRFRTPEDLGILLRERRTALGLSQAALAERVGVSRQWIVDLEQGKPRLEIGLVLRTAEALGRSSRSVRTDPAMTRVSCPPIWQRSSAARRSRSEPGPLTLTARRSRSRSSLLLDARRTRAPRPEDDR
jgi:y4mF family transcriptional regulator